MGNNLIAALKKVSSKDPYAVVDRAFTNDWKIYFRWANSVDKVFQGNFKTEKEAIDSIPLTYKKIIVQYGNVNKTINR